MEVNLGAHKMMISLILMFDAIREAIFFYLLGLLVKASRELTRLDRMAC